MLTSWTVATLFRASGYPRLIGVYRKYGPFNSYR